MNQIFFFQGQSVSNVGNAFYEAPIAKILSEYYDASFYQIHIPFSFIDSRYSSSEFSFLSSCGHLTFSSSDVFVFAGPLGNSVFLNALLSFMRSRSYSQRPQYVFLNFGFTHYNSIEFSLIKDLFELKTPNFVFARDNFSFDFLTKSYPSLPCESFPDYAFFISKIFPGLKFPLSTQYITSCFDNSIEPFLSSSSDSLDHLSSSLSYKSTSKFSRLCEILSLYLNFPIKHAGPHNWKDYLIIRPIHSILPSRPSRYFLKKNYFISESFVDYLSLYSHTSFTLSDRIHAVVGSLSFGKSALLLSKSPRQKLFAYPDLVIRSASNILSINTSIRDEQWSRLLELLPDYFNKFVFNRTL